MCRYWKKGSCQFGNVCEFTHQNKIESLPQIENTVNDDITEIVIENRNDNEMEVDHYEESVDENKFKCEWCHVDVRNYSFTSYACKYCEKSCCASSCSVMAINAQNKGMKKLSIEFQVFEHICAKCLGQKVG